MYECKDCTCTAKYVNNLFNLNMKNSKNILCKKNNTNAKFIMPIEFMFYLTSLTMSAYYNYNNNKNKNKKISYI